MGKGFFLGMDFTMMDQKQISSEKVRNLLNYDLTLVFSLPKVEFFFFSSFALTDVQACFHV